MIIRYLASAVHLEQKDRKQLLIGKVWKANDPYNFQTGLIGTKKKDGDWDFSDVTLHPGDRIFIKLNKWKTRLRDPEFLLYVENQPNGAKLKKKPT